MDFQPCLQGDLVTLRPLRLADYDVLYTVAKDPLIWAQHPCRSRWRPDVFRSYFEESLASGGALVVIDQKTGAIIGASRYKALSQSDDAVEIGWSFLSRSKWGGVYNGAVKRLMLRHAFTSYDYVVFYIDQANLRSCRACEKIGAQVIDENQLVHLNHPDPSVLTYVIRSSTMWIE